MKATARLREVTAADLPLLRAKVRAQNQRLGSRLQVPDLMHFPTLLCLVGETEDGELTGFVYFEAQVELAIVADEPQMILEALKLHQQMKFNMRARGLRHIRSFVDKRVDKPIGKRLQQIDFVPMNEHYVHYAFDLMPEEDSDYGEEGSGHFAANERPEQQCGPSTDSGCDAQAGCGPEQCQCRNRQADGLESV